MSPIRLAWLNLTRRRVPTLIALVAIALSVATSGVLFRLYLLSGARFSTMAGGVDAVVGAKAGGIDILLGSLNAEGPYPGFLPYKLFQSLRERRSVVFEDGASSATTGLSAAVPFLYFGKHEGCRIAGTDETFLQTLGARGAAALDGRWARASGETVIGAALARARGRRVGDVIRGTSWTGNNPAAPARSFDLKVVGILRPTGAVWDQMLFASVEQAQAVLAQADLSSQSNWRADVLNYFLIDLPAEGLPGLHALIDRRTVGQVVDVAAEKRHLLELTGAGRRIGFLVSALILLLGGLSVAAMMATRFDAMTVQLAVLRAIGYGRCEVALWLIGEGVILGCVACLLGGLGDALVFPWLRSALGPALPSAEQIACPVFRSAPVWASAVLATVLAVFVPLFRLYRQDIHSSLRGL